MSHAVPQLAQQIRDGERRALARAITLVESEREPDRLQALSLLQELGEPPASTLRLGISGVPGGGKSTLIESLGNRLLDQGRRLAVLTIDPSSQRSGGSILGDKTRMPRLAARAEAYVRPSPSRGALGGLAPHTREAIVLCEHAGYDTVIVETVGVGQSEAQVVYLVDCLLLLHLAGSGDELQGIKRGLLELADLVFVNKSDRQPEAARLAAEQLRASLRVQRPRRAGWAPRVLCGSALTGEGLDALWAAVLCFDRALGDERRARQRQQHNTYWLRERVTEGLWQSITRDPGLAAQWADVQQQVASGGRDPASAAAQILQALRLGR